MTQPRRTFLKNTAAIAAGTVLLPYCSSPTPEKKMIGVQLYTVRDLIREDLQGTLKKVAEIGYNHVELADYQDGKFYGQDPETFRKMVNDLGMEITCSHVRYEHMTGDFERMLEGLVATGQRYVAIPWLPPENRNIEFYKSIVAFMNEKGKICKEAGIQLTYHNHDFEFDTIDGIVPLEMMLNETDPELVKFELDLYWVVRAGKDPVEVFKKNPGRFALWHVKDMDGTDQSFAAVGTGTIDFKAIFDNAGVSGMETFFVEQDRSDDPLASIKTSFQNVSKLMG